MFDRSAPHAAFDPGSGRARLTSGAAALTALLAVVGCAGASRGVPVENLPPAPPPDPEYRVAVGDLLSVRVWNQDSMSQARARVRDDGRISVPFLQDVEVEGETTVSLSRRLESELKGYVVNPVVTVIVEEVRALRISVIGEVARPGIYELERGAGVLAALAAGGGLTAYAHRDHVYVVRRGRPSVEGGPIRIRFSFAALTRADRPAASFALQHGDTVVVE